MHFQIFIYVVLVGVGTLVPQNNLLESVLSFHQWVTRLGRRCLYPPHQLASLGSFDCLRTPGLPKPQSLLRCLSAWPAAQTTAANGNDYANQRPHPSPPISAS